MGMTWTLDWDKYTLAARNVIAEGCVLLKNENNALPLSKSAFSRTIIKAEQARAEW